MNSSPSGSVTFGPYRLFATARVLERDGVSLELGSRALDILIALIERAGEIVEHRELIARVWRGLVVDGGNLRVQVTNLRRTLGDGEGGARYIANVPGQGYSFVAPLGHVAGAIGADAVRATVAVSAAHATLRTFTNGVCRVDLGAVKDPALVVRAVALALGVSADVRNPLPTVRSLLRASELLLVLDNCEHVMAAAAALAESIHAYGDASNGGGHPATAAAQHARHYAWQGSAG